ncbi:Rubrerythrin [Denitrovibrio acetiphilus DSM 12809]|uniref:Rubrerythrin n=1 Tax=Denitrovibrio acetiphilus (strain DSM 12809 / NBRC 114555 / N2460) TaxID=522772 RepID=D4H644_DENA2|nr:rubrerythrin family protein [Denitrovibrio acetiphilus]ADD67690.1 Rubrerythrin [Denitrovibrio acetiphilus DSM 12809]
MAKSLKGTATLENLMKSFAGESQARNRYDYYAGVAGKEGFKQIQNIFLETSINERMHAKRFFQYACDGVDEMPLMVNINADYPVAFSSTLDNLKYAADGEHEEWEILYPNFAKIAAEEGFPHIEALFNKIAAIEAHHEARYLKLAQNMKDGLIFKKNEVVQWKCLVCGHVHSGIEAPTVCPVCAHKQEHFELFIETY